MGQDRHIVQSVAKRRNRNGNDIQAEKQILPELLRLLFAMRIITITMVLTQVFTFTVRTIRMEQCIHGISVTAQQTVLRLPPTRMRREITPLVLL